MKNLFKKHLKKKNNKESDYNILTDNKKGRKVFSCNHYFLKNFISTITQSYTFAIFLSTGSFLSRAVIYVREVAWVGGGYRHMYALHTEEGRSQVKRMLRIRSSRVKPATRHTFLECRSTNPPCSVSL